MVSCNWCAGTNCKAHLCRSVFHSLFAKKIIKLVCFILSYISICIPSWRPYLKVACENNMCFICAFLNMYFEATFQMRRPGVYWILIKYAFIWVFISNICAHVLQYFLIKETRSILIFFTYVFILVYIIVIQINFTYNRKYYRRESDCCVLYIMYMLIFPTYVFIWVCIIVWVISLVKKRFIGEEQWLLWFVSSILCISCSWVVGVLCHR